MSVGRHATTVMGGQLSCKKKGEKLAMSDRW
jgi:hypothetical protein